MKKGRLFFTNSYRIINIFFTAFILGIFIYSITFSPGKRQYPIPSVQKLLTGENSISTGLSRGFSSLVRFQLNEALEYNPYSIRIFVFFLLQLLFRISALIIQSRPAFGHARELIMVDILVSASLFIFCFAPFLADMFI